MNIAISMWAALMSTFMILGVLRALLMDGEYISAVKVDSMLWAGILFGGLALWIL